MCDQQANFISDLLTAESITSKTEHVGAEKILPSNAMCFDDILIKRHLVRDLLWLPVKTDAQRAEYKLLNQEEELAKIKHAMGSEKFLLAENQYPYLLPPDVHQRLIWVAENVTRSQLLEFIKNILEIENLSHDEVIMFERPSNTSTPLIKGTFKHLRHVHFWSRT